MGSPTVYNVTILYENPVLVILRPWTNLWVEQEKGERWFDIFLDFLKSPSHIFGHCWPQNLFFGG